MTERGETVPAWMAAGHGMVTNSPAGIRSCGILEKQSSEAKECLIRHKDGFDAPVIKKAGVVKDEKGRVLGVVETITDLTELKQARQQASAAALRLAEVHRMENIYGKSHAMQQVFATISAAAASDATVLIQGESGTGKELVAGAIHYQSRRRDMPLVTVNCRAGEVENPERFY